MESFSDVEVALEEAYKISGKNSSVIFMPHGGSVLPQIKKY